MEFKETKTLDDLKQVLEQNIFRDIEVVNVYGKKGNFHKYRIIADVRIVGDKENTIYKIKYGFPYDTDGRIIVDRDHEAYQIVKSYFEAKKGFIIRYPFTVNKDELVRSFKEINGNKEGWATVELFDGLIYIK